MDMMGIRRAVLSAQDQFIPPGYQQVDHIISLRNTGNIDTGIPGDDDTLSFELCFKQDGYVGYFGLFGNAVSESSNSWRILSHNSDNGRLYATCNRIQSGSVTLIAPGNVYLGKKTILRLSYTKAEIEVDGSTFAVNLSAQKGTTNNNNVGIGYTRPAPDAKSTSTVRVTWYWAKAWRDGKLIRDYVPCVRKSDNKPGFYDRVNYTFNPSISQTDYVLE